MAGILAGVESRDKGLLHFKKPSPTLFGTLWIFLPVIATNRAILGFGFDLYHKVYREQSK
jgi:Na+-translocating ferredoxin:NAD+ oxidoreductase RnfA subunit